MLQDAAVQIAPKEKTANASQGAAPLQDRLDSAILAAREALLAKMDPGGWWCFEFEADVTIPAEYIMLLHFLGRPEPELERRIVLYIRRIQSEDGSWPLYPEGEGNLSCTVKAYYAMKLAGAGVDDPAMAKARAWIRAHGGAERVNMFTRIALALFGQIPFRALPALPVEVILLPLWFPFNMYNIATWSRTVIAPLLILLAKKPVAANPGKIGVAELFIENPADVAYFRPKNWIDKAFGWLDTALHWAEPHIPAKLRQKSIDAALAFTLERLNGEDGLNGIFPAMANALMAMDALGFPDDHPDKAVCRKSLDRLLQERGEEVYCQPCLSPTWDTAIAIHALLEAGAEPPEVKDALDWLASKQIDAPGDWRKREPGLVSGGWAFQFNNPFYPDLDDTAMVASALDRANRTLGAGDAARDADLRRADAWIIGMQGSSGGFAAYDKDNNKEYLNRIPFADHGAMLDPDCVDVTARCLGYLAQRGYASDHPAQARAIAYIKAEQEPDGSWYGRWGVNYIYGVWSALIALNMAGLPPQDECIHRALRWLRQIQNQDGGFGETTDDYIYRRYAPAGKSVPSQTGWALLAFCAAGEAASDSARRAADWLLANQRGDGLWRDEIYTGTGFPRMFYLHYHGYQAYFPLLALARWRNLNASGAPAPQFAI
ncbi:squalene--hopene cyclase [uncultured Rhodoblastus sp.]|uniref:squalene--hopene cyclase n=1 Tax=uncultured Rhodoblastus sp. TaxID=543037 RepID=UPI0025DFB1E3|nr:squalene--hopene cyclase [uncultured Rhodoblastus sp.]